MKRILAALTVSVATVAFAADAKPAAKAPQLTIEELEQQNTELQAQVAQLREQLLNTAQAGAQCQVQLLEAQRPQVEAAVKSTQEAVTKHKK